MALPIARELHGDCTKQGVQSKNATKGIAQSHGHSRLHGNCPRDGASPFPEQACFFSETPRMDRRQRAQAFNAWVAEGRPWPPPAGLTSALISAVLPSKRERKW